MKPSAVIIAGLGFGDEGKGATVDYLSRQLHPDLIIRYNGGAQALHHVVTDDGREHGFAQYGSGAFVNVPTFLSRFCLLNPGNMLRERQHLVQLGLEPKAFVEGNALIITPFQQALNRLAEWARGHLLHGSCGQGIGQTRSDFLKYGEQVLFAKDLKSPVTARQKLQFLQDKAREAVTNRVSFSGLPQIQEHLSLIDSNVVIEYLLREYERWLRTVDILDHVQSRMMIKTAKTLVFEGAQGVLLDETHGFLPYNTWTDTTFHNAEHLLRDAGWEGEIRKLGVIRAYQTRHGAGPFPTEEGWNVPEKHNETGNFQGNFRVGAIDTCALKYAIQICGGVDEIYMTCIDRLQEIPELKVGRAYSGFNYNDVQREAWKTDWSRRLFGASPVYIRLNSIAEYLKSIQDELDVAITNISFGPTASQRFVCQSSSSDPTSKAGKKSTMTTAPSKSSAGRAGTVST